MSTELHDEVPVPEFEDELWRQLARIHDQERTEAPSAPAAARQRTPMRGRRTVLAGVGSIAAAAALLAAIVATGTGTGSDGSGRDQLDIEARIIAASEAAMSDFVVHETTDYAGTDDSSDFESWRDEASLSVRTLSYTPDGEPVSDRGQTELPPPPPPGDLPPGTRQVRTIDYCAEVYMIEEVALYPEGSTEVSVLTPIVDGLTDGYMHVDGTERVGGRDLLRVIEDEGPFATWLVDPETYRPVLLRAEVGEGNTRAFVQTYEYLPRTPENLANLQAADPPAGFVQVDEQDWPADPGACD